MKRSNLRLNMLVNNTHLTFDVLIKRRIRWARLTLAILSIKINRTNFIIILYLFNLLKVIFFLRRYWLWTIKFLIKRNFFLIWWSRLIHIIYFWFLTWNCINRTQKITKLNTFANSFLIFSIFNFFINFLLVSVLFIFFELEIFR